jgi:hypothetical protein
MLYAQAHIMYSMLLLLLLLLLQVWLGQLPHRHQHQRCT